MKVDLAALRAIAATRDIRPDELFRALQDGLLAAYRAREGAVEHSRVVLDRETGQVRVLVRDPEPAPPVDGPGPDDEDPKPGGGGEVRVDADEVGGERDPDDDVGAGAPSQEPPRTVLGPERDDTPEDFDREAAQVARAVVVRRVRDAESAVVVEDFAARIGQVVSGLVQQAAAPRRGVRQPVRVLLAERPQRVEGVLVAAEQVPTERYPHGRRLRALVIQAASTPRGPRVVLSRTHPDLVRGLLAAEVPEVAEGVVEVVAVAREAGSRSKVAVRSRVPRVNPTGACIGPQGSRVQAVSAALDGEKIDLVRWADDPAERVAAALAPARVVAAELVDPDTMAVRVAVADDQLSLAIGKQGQNARLAARLTGCRVDVRATSDPDAPRPRR